MSRGKSTVFHLAYFAVIVAVATTPPGERQQTLSRRNGEVTATGGATSVDAITGKKIFAGDSYHIRAGMANQSATNCGFSWRSK